MGADRGVIDGAGLVCVGVGRQSLAGVGRVGVSVIIALGTAAQAMGARCGGRNHCSGIANLYAAASDFSADAAIERYGLDCENG